MSPSDYELIEQGYDPPLMTHERREAVEAMRAKCEAIARDTIPEVSMHDYEDGFAAAAQQIADAIAALKDKSREPED